MTIVRLIIFLPLLLIQASNSYAAFFKNTDSKPQSLVIIEDSSRRDVILQPDQELGLCIKGCFITLPNGDRFYIKADETIEINNGRASFK